MFALHRGGLSKRPVVRSGARGAWFPGFQRDSPAPASGSSGTFRGGHTPRRPRRGSGAASCALRREDERRGAQGTSGAAPTQDSFLTRLPSCQRPARGHFIQRKTPGRALPRLRAAPAADPPPPPRAPRPAGCAASRRPTGGPRAPSATPSGAPPLREPRTGRARGALGGT